MFSVIGTGMSGICSQIQFADLACIKNSDLGPRMRYIHFQTICLRLPHNDVRSRVLLVHCLLRLSPRWKITMHNACKQPLNAVRIEKLVPSHAITNHLSPYTRQSVVSGFPSIEELHWSPLYSRTLHILGLRFKTSWVTSWIVVVFVLLDNVVYHFASRIFPSMHSQGEWSSSKKIRCHSH